MLEKSFGFEEIKFGEVLHKEFKLDHHPLVIKNGITIHFTSNKPSDLHFNQKATDSIPALTKKNSINPAVIFNFNSEVNFSNRTCFVPKNQLNNLYYINKDLFKNEVDYKIIYYEQQKKNWYNKLF